MRILPWLKNLFSYSLVFFICLLLNISESFSQQWQLLGLKSEVITSIAVDRNDSNVIYAGSRSDFSSGAVGGLFKSTNSGITWDTLIRGVTVRQIIFHPTNSSILWASLGINYLTKAGIIKTTDSGNSWFKSDSGIAVSSGSGPGPIAIDPFEPYTLYTGTGGIEGGFFYKSTDGGLTWRVYNDSTNLFEGNSVVSIAIRTDSSNHIYAGTDWIGRFLESYDYGENWSLIDLPIVDDGLIYSITLSQDQSTIYVGSGWTRKYSTPLFKSTDNGKNWSNPHTGLPDTSTIFLISDKQIDGEDLLLCIANTSLYKLNEDSIWEKISQDSLLIKTFTVSNSKIYVGAQGIYSLTSVVSVKNKITLEPKEFLLFNNYPNPFNPSTTISFEIEKAGKYKLDIYDLIGNKIKSISNSYYYPGYYSLVWDGDNIKSTKISSGIYFYVFSSSNQIIAKKMVLLK